MYRLSQRHERTHTNIRPNFRITNLPLIRGAHKAVKSCTSSKAKHKKDTVALSSLFDIGDHWHCASRPEKTSPPPGVRSSYSMGVDRCGGNRSPNLRPKRRTLMLGDHGVGDSTTVHRHSVSDGPGRDGRRTGTRAAPRGRAGRRGAGGRRAGVYKSTCV